MSVSWAMRAALSKLLTQQTNGTPATHFLLHFSNFQPFFALKFLGEKKKKKKKRKGKRSKGLC